MTPLLVIAVSNARQLHIFGWVALALGVGGAVGLEREYRGHVAGVRTASLVCGGAAMFTQVSLLFGDSRIASNVVQGIGFLGVGLMFHNRRGDVKGVTTAATMWAVAALGLVIGYELWLTGILASAALITLLELAPVSDWVLTHGHAHHSPPAPAPPPSSDGAANG